jgi:hypothetical protein
VAYLGAVRGVAGVVVLGVERLVAGPAHHEAEALGGGPIGGGAMGEGLLLLVVQHQEVVAVLAGHGHAAALAARRAVRRVAVLL